MYARFILAVLTVLAICGAARAGGAVLFGWIKFRLEPGLNYFSTGDGFFFPIIGLWWRFEAWDSGTSRV